MSTKNKSSIETRPEGSEPGIQESGSPLPPVATATPVKPATPPNVTPVGPYRSEELRGRTVCFHDDAGQCYSATLKPLGPIPADAPKVEPAATA
ncbi:MAG: hypothetical protein Fur0032_20990 [Terrimicrobiaceae bacterium]